MMNPESQRRQDDLMDTARGSGRADIDVIDDDPVCSPQSDSTAFCAPAHHPAGSPLLHSFLQRHLSPASVQRDLALNGLWHCCAPARPLPARPASRAGPSRTASVPGLHRAQAQAGPSV